MNQKNSQFILHLRFVFMSLTSTADFQFPLEEPLDGRLFTRRKDLTNNIRLLIGTNGLHAILNGTWGTITHLANEYGISRTFIYSLANNLKKVGQFLFEETTATTPASLHREHAVSKVRRALPDLFHYFDIATKVVNECQELGLDEEALKAYCVAWQWGKAARKAKKSGRKKIAIEQEQFCLEIASGLHQQESEAVDGSIQKEVYSRLDKIVQSSALVECINSIIRPYLNTSKNHVNQEQLNLIMHYHNHRRYRDGVRKGKTPMELLTGKEQTKDWLAILLEIIRAKKPELLLAS